jgi:hypothetical protein
MFSLRYEVGREECFRKSGELDLRNHGRHVFPGAVTRNQDDPAFLHDPVQVVTYFEVHEVPFLISAKNEKRR